MAWRPHTVIGACPECGGTPEPKFKSWSVRLVRMECKCGVSGAWREHDYGDPWHAAVRGWHGLPVNMGSPPPMPRR